MEAEQFMGKKQYIVWYRKYSVGNEILDSQHKEMFNTINALYALISTGAEHMDIMKTIRYLHQYANAHFQEEEKAMQECGYPAFFSHKVMHWIYISKVNYFMEQFQNTDIDIQHSVLFFLKNWWKNHILIVDQKYKSYLSGPRGEEYARAQSARRKKGNEEKRGGRQEKRRQQWSSNKSKNNSIAEDEKYYAEILELPGLITRDSLKKAYHQKVKEYHPDHVANLGLKIRLTAAEEMEKINEAFDFFRKKYDSL